MTILTTEQIEARADELSAALNVKVYPMELYLEDKPEAQVIGFLREPNRLAKIRSLDMAQTHGSVESATTLLETCLIKEHSDPRIWSEDSAYDKLYIGAAMAASNLVQVSVNQFKKK